MELRHLRYFLAVAEELHFARAAERLHIEQSPLSRAVKELEYDLGVQLFERTTRTTRLTWAGQVFIEDVRRIFAAVDQARANAKSAASGCRGTLRIALSDGMVPVRLASLLARCRADEPEVAIRLFQTSFGQQVKGLREDRFDAGFAPSAEVGEGILAAPVWTDPLVVAVPARHPLLAHKRVPLEELTRHPLVLCHPDGCESSGQQIERSLRAAGIELQAVERVMTHDLLLTMIAAGYGVGLLSASQMEVFRYPEVVARPLAERSVSLTTYLLRPDIETPVELSHFIDRVSTLDLPMDNEKGGQGHV